MKTFTKFLIILIFISCQPVKKKSNIESIKSDTIELNGSYYIEYKKDGKLWSITDLFGDTIIKAESHYFEATFPDIDEDGYCDIKVSAVSHTPNQSENYLFDTLKNCFRKLGNSDLDIKKLKGVKLYYSYNSMGCSDNIWESRLSKIENWKEIPIGHIKTLGCGEKSDGIYIYKTNGESEILLNVLPIDSLIRSTYKWSFIERYWERNYLKFF